MKNKRYQEGGEAEGASGTAGRSGMERGAGQRTTDDMTFGEAFREARNAGKGTFSWRGKSYTTKTKEETPKASDLKEVEVTGKRREMPAAPARSESSAPKKKKTFGGALAAKIGTTAQRRRGAEEGYEFGDIMKSIRAGLGTQRTREALADEYEGVNPSSLVLAGLGGGAAGMGARALGRAALRRMAGRAAGRSASGESMAQRRIREARERQLDESLAANMEGGFKRGGGVKKYNKGGKIDGIAKRGKTRGRMI